ncbi:hypothetical protein [Cytophaga sp. FL35]|uniref:hypothetical protein n=1 Tax=Cytophaga sp. FL35 TaxID=1904456 RepID=UPI001653E70D|nr:hypothetical protein [Cytophaga sp. FL35]MBC7000719.1 hypothetical protein [Cytophaga sp. FL35]
MINKSTFFLLLLPLIAATLFVSCSNHDDSDQDCGQVICIAEFVRILVSVTDENQNPILLDSFEVVNLENGKNITIQLSTEEFEGLREYGKYPLIEDGILGLNEERIIQFRGFIDNQEVVGEAYTVGTDCCHVGLVSGNLQL